VKRGRLVLGLTVVFAAMTGTVVLIALATAEPVLFVVAVPLAATTGVFWYQSSGRLRERVARSRADRATGAGRDERFGAGARSEARRDRRRRAGRSAGGARSGAKSDVTRSEAYRLLDLEPTDDDAAVRAAYRRKVKDVHPDRGGDEQAFKRVTEAYETLVE